MAADGVGTKLVVEYEALRRREHELITKLLDVLPRIDNLPEDRVTQVRDALFHADNPFLIVCMGPFNSGKSSIINALLGEVALPVGPVPTTDRIVILRYGETSQRVRSGEYDTLFHPAPLLQKVSFVDTPGLESVFQKHEDTTRKFLHRADVVLLVMLATQAMTMHTLDYLRTLQEYGKTVILVLNQSDLISEDEGKTVRDYVIEQIHSQLGYKPEVWLMSARRGAEARGEDGTIDRELWRESGLGQIESYVDRQLGDVARLRQKLQTPLQIIQNVNQAALEAVRANQSALDQYQSIGQNLEQQLAAQKRDQDKIVRETVEQVNTKFADASKRGGDAIRDIFKLGNALGSFGRGVMELVGLGRMARGKDGEYVKQAFERFRAFEPIDELPEVTDKMPPRLEGQDMQDIEALVKYSRREIDALPGGIRDKVIGDIKPPLKYERETLASIRPQLETLEQEARVVETSKLEQTVRNTLLYLGAWQVLMIVLALFLLFGGAAFTPEQSGLRWGFFIAILGFMLLGFMLLPLRGRWLAGNHASRLDQLQARYVEILGKAADKQVNYGMQLRRDAVAPLTRLVEAQTGIQTGALQSLQQAQQEMVKIEGELAGLGKLNLFGLRG
ncbi:MAG: dynamin family protein [Chloroflexota bacterium]|nr:dynamin family protein [Chloroflexota bacterium]